MGLSVTVWGWGGMGEGSEIGLGLCSSGLVEGDISGGGLGTMLEVGGTMEDWRLCSKWVALWSTMGGRGALCKLETQ